MALASGRISVLHVRETKTCVCVCVSPESIPVIKEEVFRLHLSEIQFGVVTTKDDFIPQHHLIQRLRHMHCLYIKRLYSLIVTEWSWCVLKKSYITPCGILGRQIEEQLFNVPVKDGLQM